MKGHQLMIKPEILAPAGSFEAFIAAVHSGCDAVYLGGSKYGARAYAKNFDLETLERAISYARNFGVKIYYTINTLFKEKEIDSLMTHINEVYQLGIDALIVQDLGVISLLQQFFPSLELHASTQINCHSVAGIQFLQDLGIKRVVLARELSLDEIIYIKKHTKMPIEAFVHGALCYSYSGQCLMSSFMGGRSGNRGRCAQPCRLNYKVTIDQQVYESSHVLSPKDIETITVLPELIEAGIDSFKIEGRMKSKEYVTLMTTLYRYYTDTYVENGVINVKQKDLDDMAQIFNRGNFTNGYYFQHNNSDMITFEQPKHQGRVIGKVSRRKGETYTISLFEPVQKGDCLEINMGLGDNYSWIVQTNNRFEYSFNPENPLEVGKEVRRIKSTELL
jgi:putative protease